MDIKAYIIAAIASIPAVFVNESIKSFTEDKKKFIRIRNLFIKYSFFSLCVIIFFMFQLDRYDNPFLKNIIDEEHARFYFFLWVTGVLIFLFNRLVIVTLVKRLVDKISNNKRIGLFGSIFSDLDEMVKGIINVTIGFIAFLLISWIPPLQRVTEFKNLTEASVVEKEGNVKKYDISIPENTKFNIIYQTKNEQDNYRQNKLESGIPLIDSVFILERESIVVLEEGTEIILPPNKNILLNKDSREMVESKILTSNSSKGQLNEDIYVQIAKDSEIYILYKKNWLYYVLFEVFFICYTLSFFYPSKKIFLKYIIRKS